MGVMSRPSQSPQGTWRKPTAHPDLRSLPRHSPQSYTPRRAPGSASSRDSGGRAGEAGRRAGGGAAALEGGSASNVGNFQTGRPRVPEFAVPLQPWPPQRPGWPASWTPPLASVWPPGPTEPEVRNLRPGERIGLAQPVLAEQAQRSRARITLRNPRCSLDGGLVLLSHYRWADERRKVN